MQLPPLHSAGHFEMIDSRSTIEVIVYIYYINMAEKIFMQLIEIYWEPYGEHFDPKNILEI